MKDKENIKDSLKEFRKMFPDTDEGQARFIDGYLYATDDKTYIYHMVRNPNKQSKGLVYPEGVDPKYDQILQTVINHIKPKMPNPDTNTYHGKVMRFEDVKKIVTLDVDLDLGTLDKSIIPFEHCRDVILKNPDKLVVIDCACRSTKEDGCYPRDTCIWIGEPFYSFILDHNTTGNPRKITPDEALAIIEAERGRGHIQNAFFKDAMGDRLYCICNCCSCCCNAIKAQNYTTIPTLIPSGYLRHTNADNCVGCGKCVEVCNFKALSLVEGKAVVDEAKCMGCGLCESVCVNGGPDLRRDPSKTEPLDLDELRQKYNK